MTSEMMIEVELAFNRCRVHTRSVLMPCDMPVAVSESDPFGTGQLVARTLQVPFHFVIRQTDLEQHFPD